MTLYFGGKPLTKEKNEKTLKDLKIKENSMVILVHTVIGGK